MDAILWGLRLGPYLELPLSERFRVLINGGLALGWLDAEVTWNEVTPPGGGSMAASGGGDDLAFLVGAYAGASVAWDLSERWSVIGGAQFQYLGSYEQSFDWRSVELDFGQAIFATLGLQYSF
ncbi:MAG: hypothetical protein MUE94_09405 [Verrucomicrobia bacterium]|jgi:hypothetical protein|nr:hypothetical protein [Verrucomicrobiota bacterium]